MPSTDIIRRRASSLGVIAAPLGPVIRRPLITIACLDITVVNTDISAFPICREGFPQ